MDLYCWAKMASPADFEPNEMGRNMKHLLRVVAAVSIFVPNALAQELDPSLCEPEGFLRHIGAEGVFDASLEMFHVIGAFKDEVKCVYRLPVPECFKKSFDRAQSIAEMDLIDSSCASRMIDDMNQLRVGLALVETIQQPLTYKVKKGWFSSEFTIPDETKWQKKIAGMKERCEMNDDDLLSQMKSECEKILKSESSEKSSAPVRNDLPPCSETLRPVDCIPDNESRR